MNPTTAPSLTFNLFFLCSFSALLIRTGNLNPDQFFRYTSNAIIKATEVNVHVCVCAWQKRVHRSLFSILFPCIFISYIPLVGITECCTIHSFFTTSAGGMGIDGLQFGTLIYLFHFALLRLTWHPGPVWWPFRAGCKYTHRHMTTHYLSLGMNPLEEFACLLTRDERKELLRNRDLNRLIDKPDFINATNMILW